MKKIQRFWYMALGAILTLIICATTPVMASVQRQITAYFNNIKIYVDGALITPKDANGNIVEPFIADGTTYLPVRALAEALGKTVEWDGATSSVYIGARPGSIKYMPDVVPAYQSRHYTEISSLIDGGTRSFMMAGQRYINGCFWSMGPSRSMYSGGGYSLYNLNGQYKRISGRLGHIDTGGRSDATLYIYKDGILYREIELKADIMPQNISIDVTGVLQLKMELHGFDVQYGFADLIIE